MYGDRDLLTNKRDRVYRGGFETEDDAWTNAIKAKAEVDKGKPVRSANVSVKDFFVEWLVSVKESIKGTTYANYVDNIDAYIVPMLGQRKLKEVNDVQVLNAFYRQLLAEGRRKPDNNTVMYDYWVTRHEQRNGLGPTPTEISKACKTTIHAAKKRLSFGIDGAGSPSRTQQGWRPSRSVTSIG